MILNGSTFIYLLTSYYCVFKGSNLYFDVFKKYKKWFNR